MEEAQRAGRELLTGAVETPGLDSDVLLAALLGWERSELFGRSRETLAPEVREAYLRMVRSRAGRHSGGIPDRLEGLVRPSPGSVAVGPDPTARNRTAGRSCGRAPWLDASSHWSRTSGRVPAPSPSRWRAQIPDAEIIAVDVSHAAIDVARENVARYDLEDRIRLLQGDLIEALDRAPDLIVANLPYVSMSDRAELPAEVLAEPSVALFAGEDGTERIQASSSANVGARLEAYCDDGDR